MTDKKLGFLLMNIGTPTNSTVKSIRAYLKEFLSDPDVIDTNALIRWAIVNLIVVPFRPKMILHQYQSIWTDEGSPLLVNSKNFIEKISMKTPNHVFELGMRYGSPSIEDGLMKLTEQRVDQIVLVPMFPQYANATSGSCIKKAVELIKDLNIKTPYKTIDYFYDNEAFIDSLVESINKSKQYLESEFLLFSFHGLPKRQIKKMDSSNSYCLTEFDCCKNKSEYNEMCYSHQCYETVDKVIKKLKPNKPYGLGFQSRFGLDAWLEPNTTDVIENLPSKNINNISVVCPAFVFDCLETLEEIAIRNNEYFIDSGGTGLKLIPSVNDENKWVDRFSKFLIEKTY
tara:strand:+ start:602 stop:1627 length:1026 start_codon:yes stop_codon:yes gene_type:complete